MSSQAYHIGRRTGQVKEMGECEANIQHDPKEKIQTELDRAFGVVARHLAQAKGVVDGVIVLESIKFKFFQRHTTVGKK